MSASAPVEHSIITPEVVFTSFIHNDTKILRKSELDMDQQKRILPIISPATNEPVFWFLPASEKDVDWALECAKNRYMNTSCSEGTEGTALVWTQCAPKRAQVLMNIASLLRENVDRLADLEVMQIGRPRKEMRFQLSRLPEWFEYFASLLRVHEESIATPFHGYLNLLKRVPLGVCVQITPFNHPLLITIKKLAPAIAAGNTVVIKPSELAPATIIELAKLCKQAGLPSGVMNVVLGDKEVSSRLISDNRVAKVDFTGGPKTGRAIGQIAGGNLASVTQELGGKAPMIVFAPKYAVSPDEMDKYIDPIVNGCAFGAFIASGQTCIAGTRILVQASLYERFCQKLVQKTKVFRMGDPMDMHTTIGPIITKRQMEWIDDVLRTSMNDDLEILCGGARYQGFTGKDEPLNNGNYYESTVVAVKSSGVSLERAKEIHHSNPLYQTELFGPVVVLAPFEDQADGIMLANDTDFSLGCSIWTKDLIQAHQVADQVRAGIVWINDHHKNHPSSPWGGLTKESGVGRENGVEAYHEYSQTKSIVVNMGEFTSDWFQDPNARYN